MNDKKMSRYYLRKHPDHIFVYGDNLERKGHGGAASLRDEPNTYGFVTKKKPTNEDDAFYTLEDYEIVFHTELTHLISEIFQNPQKTYLISALGSGLANKHKIWEEVIEGALVKVAESYSNVKLLFDVKEEEPRFYSQELDDNNRTDIVKSIYADELEAIVDEEAGGIIGYINRENSNKIIEILNSAVEV